MAIAAREIFTDGLTTELFKWDPATGQYDTTAVQLCGHDSATFTPGNTTQTETTDYCQAATGNKSYITGARENGTLTFNLNRRDPQQEGQKLWHDAEMDAKFKVVITYPTGDICTVEVQKKKDFGFEHKVGDIIKSSSLEMATISKDVWTK